MYTDAKRVSPYAQPIKQCQQIIEYGNWATILDREATTSADVL